MKRFLLATALLISAALIPVRAQLNVTTYHNDNARTGQNTQETILTPANVTFTNGAQQIGTGTLNGGVATMTTTSLRVGSHVLKATYPGDANFATSAGYVKQTD